ncbi:PREDICTED: uncharacterized protein LOC105567782 isoform X2 [Vollenhovia emeryi]|uniref:uncharacterized protein LOC105567782 isoform X2 n=1 Tax=Vollenhovia emeryi TaxID=411798 RepID=UPI0005F511EC|nr:PREDICTED: uncharacterized protein LOC105567782 isoform X2 [Vollenhovia emeryi]
MDFMLLLLVMLLRQEVAALKLLHINVPAYTLRGKSALLECRYDRERDRLYGITWYKDHERSRSDAQTVTLQDANLHASGMYKCEVNGEGPSFNTVSAEARMEVIALPQERPTITGEEKVYASGDVLALNCTSSKSHPAAKLRWFVNGQQVKPDSEQHFEQHGLYSTISSLLLELEPGHLAGDKINVRCESTVQSSHDNDPFVDVRNTEVYVQGLATLTTPSLCLLMAAVLQRFLLPV